MKKIEISQHGTYLRSWFVRNSQVYVRFLWKEHCEAYLRRHLGVQEVQEGGCWRSLVDFDSYGSHCAFFDSETSPFED